jgi:branched-chain amino acid transport system substrate-binding protein
MHGNLQNCLKATSEQGGRMSKSGQRMMIGAAAIIFAFAAAVEAEAKDKVKVGFIGPLTGGVSVNGLGGRNSADLAVRLRNSDPKAKYEYELLVLDDECKPNVAVQVATKMAADKEVIAGATHYCSVAAIATVVQNLSRGERRARRAAGHASERHDHSWLVVQ